MEDAVRTFFFAEAKGAGINILVNEITHVHTKVNLAPAGRLFIIQHHAAITVKESLLIVLTGEYRDTDGHICVRSRRGTRASGTAGISVRRDEAIVVPLSRREVLDKKTYREIRFSRCLEFPVKSDFVKILVDGYFNCQVHRTRYILVDQAGPQHHCIGLRVGRCHALGKAVSRTGTGLNCGHWRTMRCDSRHDKTSRRGGKLPEKRPSRLIHFADFSLVSGCVWDDQSVLNTANNNNLILVNLLSIYP